MSEAETKQSLGEKLQSLPKLVLYIILFSIASIPLFFDVTLPNKPVDASIDFYGQLMAIPDGSRVLVGSDWTNSTRGESRGEMEAMVRILMRKNIKFAVYSTGDPQSPQVFRDVINDVAKEHAKEGGAPYKPFENWISLGYFPNTEGTLSAIENNIVAAFSGKKDLGPNGPTDVFQSPVFAGVKSIKDFEMLILVTPSDTNNKTLERIKKIPLMFMVTGVMVPENTSYYASGQLKGLVGGVKGVYDLEQLMEAGINNDGASKIESPKYEQVKGWPGKTNKGKGTRYILALHFCLGLLVLTVLVGNVGMALARKKSK